MAARFWAFGPEPPWGWLAELVERDPGSSVESRPASLLAAVVLDEDVAAVPAEEGELAWGLDPVVETHAVREKTNVASCKKRQQLDIMILMETLYITHPAFRLHEMGEWHPECPQRLDAISDQLLSSGIASYLNEEQAVQPVCRQALERVHQADYLDRLEAMAPIDGYSTIDPDTMMNPHTLEAARLAAGAVVLAVDAVMRDQASTAFCAVRPPGHHAMPNQAMGFCFYNNVAVAAAHAMETYGLKRIALIDFDVHHGNGTEAIFAGDERVLMCSFYQHPLFPNIQIEPMPLNMVNIPVPPYTSGADIREVVRQHWLPRLEAHQPELVFISAGFDAHREDDMGQLGLVESDYAWMTQQVVAIADRHAQGRVVSALEGGYHLSALARSVIAHIRALAKI